VITVLKHGPCTCKDEMGVFPRLKVLRLIDCDALLKMCYNLGLGGLQTCQDLEDKHAKEPCSGCSSAKGPDHGEYHVQDARGGQDGSALSTESMLRVHKYIGRLMERP
jgi:hypothetical protein